MNKFFSSIWNSPTITTWMSYVAQALGLFLILPLVLRNFSEAETSVWFLFSSFIALQGLADFGFKNTFSRTVAFAMGGVEKIKIIEFDETSIKKNNNNKGKVNWELIEKIISTAKTVYFRLSILIFFLMATIGTIALLKPFSQIENVNNAYWAWGVIVIVSSIRFYGNLFLVYLEGTNNIPIYKRWEALTYLGGVITSFLVLVNHGGLLELVLANQIWVLIAVLRNKFLCNYILNGNFKRFKNRGLHKSILKAVWPAAWRSGIAGIMNFGMVNLSGILYAQIGNVQNIATYLLAIRILNSIRSFSMAPFYSKLPLFSRLRAEGNIKELIVTSQRGMKLAHAVFVLSVISVGLSGKHLIALVGSNTAFVPDLMWILLSFAYFIQRYGAMHMQLFMTTHRVLSHIADTIAGLLFIVISGSLIKYIDLYAFPIGMIVGYLGFYAWYSAKHSLASLNINFFEFEKRASFKPAIFFLTYIVLDVFNSIVMR